MSLFQSFFIAARGDSNQREELNAFMKSHVIVRTIENLISSGQDCGIQILVEYKDTASVEKSGKRVDWRSSLKDDRQKAIFDLLKEFRANLAKEKKLVGAYMVCKDEHLAAIVQKPDITLEEIRSLPHANNIMLKDYAENLFNEYQRILSDLKKDEAEEIPF